MRETTENVKRVAAWVVFATVVAAFLAARARAEDRPDAAASTAAPVPNHVRLATWNLYNYLPVDRQVEGRFRPNYPKPEDEKAVLRSVIRTVAPDVLALQEVGPAPYLEELAQDLAREGAAYPHRHLLEAADPERHVAVLSRLPFAGVIDHVDLAVDYRGELVPVKRGLLEVCFADGQDGDWTLFVLHLKSRYTDHADDPLSAQWRLLEARAARARIIERVGDLSRARVVIAGDFNDTPDAPALAVFRQRGGPRGFSPLPAVDSRGETWTHHYRKGATYTQVDFLLVSTVMEAVVVPGSACIFDEREAMTGSDHRLVWADFEF